MANPFLPEDPFALAPSDQDIETFAARGRGLKPAALQDWEEYAASWQQRAERRGFANPFAMIAHDNAEAGRDERTRQAEARLQAGIGREIGGGPQPEPDAQRPADGASSDSTMTAAATSATRGNEQAGDAARDATGKGRWQGPYSEAQRQGISRLYDDLAAERVRTRDEAEARVDRLFEANPETALQLRQALRLAFDANGRLERRAPASGNGLGPFRALTLKVYGNRFDEPQREMERKVFADFERRGPYRVDEDADSETFTIAGPDSAGARAILRGPRDLVLDIANAGEGARPGLDALGLLARAKDGPQDVLRRLLPFLARREIWHRTEGEAGVWEDHGPDPEAVRQLETGVKLVQQGADPAEVAAALAPMVLHEALAPSWARIGIEAVIALSPLGTAIDAYEDFQNLRKAARENDPKAGAIAAAGLAMLVLGMVPGGKVLAAGRKLSRLGRKTYRIDNEAARKILATTEDPKEVMRIVDDHAAKQIGDTSTPKISNMQRFYDQLPARLRRKYSEEQLEAMERAFRFSIIPTAAEKEVGRFLGDVLAESRYKIMEQATVFVRAGGQKAIPDHVIVPRSLSEAELERLSRDFVDEAERMGAFVREVKSGKGDLTTPQRILRNEGNAQIGDDFFKVYNVPHHKISSEAMAEAMQTYLQSAKGKLPDGWTQKDFEMMADAIRGQVPVNASALDVIALAIGATLSRFRLDGENPQRDAI